MNLLESWTTAGDSPVTDVKEASAHQSSTELVKLRMKMGGPPSKAKYSSTTDSGPVRRLNDEKHPDKGSEKHLKPYAYTAVGALRGDGVPFA